WAVWIDVLWCHASHARNRRSRRPGRPAGKCSLDDFARNSNATLFGIAIGIPSGLAATRLIASMLFGLSPGDFSTLATACLLLLAVAFFAGYLPARRASSIDPILALRTE